MDEEDAIRHCRQGDRAAFRLLVESYGDLVYRTAYLIVRDRALAEDLTQEAFLLAWKGLGKFDPAQPFKPWLLRVAINCCLSNRRRRSFTTVPLNESGADVTVDQSLSPEEAVVLHDTQRLVREAVGSLEEVSRLVVMLRYFAELSIPEIASVLSCPQGTVKSRLHRALAQLRDRLEGKIAVPSRVGPIDAG